MKQDQDQPSTRYTKKIQKHDILGFFRFFDKSGQNGRKQGWEPSGLCSALLQDRRTFFGDPSLSHT